MAILVRLLSLPLGAALFSTALVAENAACEAVRETGARSIFHFVDERAVELAEQPFAAAPALPSALENLDYDQYRLIAFEHAEAIGKRQALPFWLEFFHRGYIFRERVKLNLVARRRVTPLVYERKQFQYRGELADLEVPDDVGFAGFRILGRFESSRNPLEIASFLGASYFRAIGEGQTYGTSARGLAVDVGMAKSEEFPAFREFWIERPAADAKQLRFWALLDSPSVTGAYEFVLRPGEATACDITARLHFRRGVEKVGIAPLTSMWMWGDGRPGPVDDSRPKVHDADGLLLHTIGGQWIWRPLALHDYVSISRFELDGLRGFGLLQRDRRPESFRDGEAKYHLRPSVWIEPREPWPAGAIELLELPAPHEGIDNIAAWWTPRAEPDFEKPLELTYTVTFRASEPKEHTLARAVATRVARGTGQPRRIEVDFSGPQLRSLAVDAITPHVGCQRGRVGEVRLARLADEMLRLSFNTYAEGTSPLELQAVLRGGGSDLTETWRYLCPTKSD